MPKSDSQSRSISVNISVSIYTPSRNFFFAFIQQKIESKTSYDYLLQQTTTATTLILTVTPTLILTHCGLLQSVVLSRRPLRFIAVNSRDVNKSRLRQVSTFFLALEN